MPTTGLATTDSTKWLDSVPVCARAVDRETNYFWPAIYCAILMGGVGPLGPQVGRMPVPTRLLG